MSEALDHPWVILSETPFGTTAYVHNRTGSGRGARRHLLAVVHTPIALTVDTFPDVLSAVAEQLRTPVLQRWQPRPTGPGSPGGRWGANQPSTLT
jgi:hypothetical protein